jgi:hypothetical protein
VQDGAKSLSVRGEFVLGAENGFFVDGALEDAGLLELAELLGEDLVRGLGDAAAKLAEAKLAVLELVEDERLPLASDDAKRG